jgi:hypothetical protein
MTPPVCGGAIGDNWCTVGCENFALGNPCGCPLFFYSAENLLSSASLLACRYRRAARVALRPRCRVLVIAAWDWLTRRRRRRSGISRNAFAAAESEHHPNENCGSNHRGAQDVTSAKHLAAGLGHGKAPFDRSVESLGEPSCLRLTLAAGYPQVPVLAYHHRRTHRSRIFSLSDDAAR